MQISTHLGNMLAVVRNKRFCVFPASDPETQVLNVSVFLPEIITAQDYYAFGMTMPGRSGSLKRLKTGINDVTNPLRLPKFVAEGTDPNLARVLSRRRTRAYE